MDVTGEFEKAQGLLASGDLPGLLRYLRADGEALPLGEVTRLVAGAARLAGFDDLAQAAAAAAEVGDGADMLASRRTLGGIATHRDSGPGRTRARSAAMRGNLVAQTAGSRRAELDVLRPVTPAAQRPCQRFGSADERAHSPRRAWLSLHRAVSGCGDPVSREDRASRPVQEALPRVPGSGRCADPRCQTVAKASPALALWVAFDQTQSGRHRRLSAW